MGLATPSVVSDVLSGTRHRPVTIKEACALLGVSRRTIYNWLAKGRLETIRTPGGSVRIFVDSLMRATERPPPAAHATKILHETDRP
jgi:excisionase family DNA binding protein